MIYTLFLHYSYTAIPIFECQIQVIFLYFSSEPFKFFGCIHISAMSEILCPPIYLIAYSLTLAFGQLVTKFLSAIGRFTFWGEFKSIPNPIDYCAISIA